jgi:hypothetical protein
MVIHQQVSTAATVKKINAITITTDEKLNIHGRESHTYF